MPAKIDPDVLAQLEHFADEGDKYALVIRGILLGSFFADVVVGVKGATAPNVIRLTGQIKNADGSKHAGVQEAIVKSIPIAGAGTLAIGAAVGTIKKTVSATELWIETDVNGRFNIDVTDASAEDCLVRLETHGGETNIVKLSFA